MTQNETMMIAGAEEGSAVISVPEDVSGLLMSGDHSKIWMCWRNNVTSFLDIPKEITKML
jgi:hypothetical protein